MAKTPKRNLQKRTGDKLKMKEQLKRNVKKREKKGILSRFNLKFREVGIHIGLGLVGLLVSRVGLLSSLTPLGVIFSASIQAQYTLSSAIGAFVGYLLFPVGDSAFRYIAALFAVVAIRLITSAFKEISDSPAFLGMITLLSITICNLVVVISGGFDAVLYLTEGIMAGGLVYFVSRALKINLKNGIGLSGEELACAVILIDLILISLLPFSIGSFSIGRLASVFLILSASRFGSVSGGATCGAAIGFCLSLASADPKFVCIYAVSGLISGLFSPAGRITTALGYGAPALISIGLFGAGEGALGLVLETLIGIALFFLCPKNIAVFLAAFFSPPVRLEGLEGMRKSLVMRLRLASSALGDVSGTIEEVAKRLGKINLPEPSDIFKKCEKDACRGCSFRLNCWETEQEETLRALGQLASDIRKGEGYLETSAPWFYKKCLRPERLEESLKSHYNDYLSRIDAEERISAVRGVVSDQFEGISDMLLDLSDEFNTARNYDLDTAQTVVSALREINLLATDCGCSVDKYGRMTIEAKIHNYENRTISRKKILDQLENACERKFLPPNLKQIDDVLYLNITEKPRFSPDIGVSQFPESRSGICGDSYAYFGDGSGRFFMLLSDGMGTGGRAAVDGAMATGLMERLIKAGFGLDCSLKILNSALLYKSSEESLATVDVACIDLHTGETSLFKAGAAPTFVRRSGRVGKAESHSLPAGILREVGFDRSSILLKKDDIVVLLSDGAIGLETDWICRELENFSEAGAQELSERIADGALRRCDKSHPDDITVMVAILCPRI